MKKAIKNIGIILGVIALDFITKSYLLFLITGRVPLFGNAWGLVPFPYLMTHVTNWFNIVFTWNPGTAFSMLRGLGNNASWVICVITGIIIFVIMRYLFKRASDYERLPLALIVGGALGNLIDRIRFGAVIDFIDWHIGGWHWPAFNVADVCICVGVGLYIINWLFARNKCLNKCKGGK
ncbi:MAG: signal peptidase II [Alphaproteobacteria bacterium]|nr:signal peptidase II [Alphaproteobacteria bacterium]